MSTTLVATVVGALVAVLSCAHVDAISQLTSAEIPFQAAQAVFASDGVTGRIRFLQHSPASELFVTVNLRGLANRGGDFKVHTYPIGDHMAANPQRTSSYGDACSQRNLGPTWDTPYRGPLGTVTAMAATKMGVAAGDMSKKFGTLRDLERGMRIGTTADEDGARLHDVQPRMATGGKFSVVGRSVVLYTPDGNPWICSNILYERPTITSLTTFRDGVLAGSRVRFTQLANEFYGASTIINAEFRYNSDHRPVREVDYTTGHRWHIHESPVDVFDNNPNHEEEPVRRNSGLTQRCRTAGRIFGRNQRAINNQEMHLPWGKGDVGFATGPLNIARNGEVEKIVTSWQRIPLTVDPGRNRAHNLQRSRSVYGRSIVVHSDNLIGPSGYLDCANIGVAAEVNYDSLYQMTRGLDDGTPATTAGAAGSLGSLAILAFLLFVFKAPAQMAAQKLFGGFPTMQLRVLAVLSGFVCFIVLMVATTSVQWSVFRGGQLGPFHFCDDDDNCTGSLDDEPVGSATIQAVRWTTAISLVSIVVAFLVPVAVHFDGIPERAEAVAPVAAALSLSMCWLTTILWPAYQNGYLGAIDDRADIDVHLGYAYWLNVGALVVSMLVAMAMWVVVWGSSATAAAPRKKKKKSSLEKKPVLLNTSGGTSDAPTNVITDSTGKPLTKSARDAQKAAAKAAKKNGGSAPVVPPRPVPARPASTPKSRPSHTMEGGRQSVAVDTGAAAAPGWGSDSD